MIRSTAGPVFTAPIRDALADLPAVDLTVAYGIAGPRGAELAVAAVTLEPDAELDARELSAALGALERSRRPTLVRVVDEIPVTTWYRPITGPLRDAGVPAESDPLPVFYRGPRADGYRRLTAADRRRLVTS